MEVTLHRILEITPSTNPVLSNPQTLADQTASFALVLMGLNTPASFYGHAREVDSTQWSWPKPPRISRRWYATVTGSTDIDADWRRDTLKDSLNGIDLHCEPVEPGASPKPLQITRQWVLWDDGHYTASVALKQWPRDVTPGWLGLALSGETPVDVGVHFAPKDPQKFARYLKTQQKWQTQALANSNDAADALGVKDAMETRSKIVAGLDRPCRVAIVLTVHALSLPELDARLRTTMYNLGLKLADVVPVDLEHDRGRYATEPLGECPVVGVWKTMDCTSLAHTGIFQPVTVEHPYGVDIAVTHGVGAFNKGGQLVSLDPFDESLEGFSGVVVGKKRMGKSYFMKQFAEGMADRGVEVTIVEQRRPPEYAVIASHPNIDLINIEEVASDGDEPEVAVEKRARLLREFTTEYWNRCRSDPRPRMLIIDEAWSLLRYAQSSGWIEEVARTCGHFGLSFWLLSQQVREFLSTGEAVLDNAEIIVCLKQMDNDLDDLAKAVGMPDPARRFLRTAARGQILLKVGDLWVACDVAMSPKHLEITTDPRDIWRRIDSNASVTDDASEDHAHEDLDDSAGEDRGADWRSRRLRVRGGRGAAGSPASVGAVR